MKFVFLLIALVCALAAIPANATVPDQYVDKEYESCAGNGQDPKRNAYCACVRDDIRKWDMAEYDAMLEEMATSMLGGGAPPEKMNNLAKSCTSKVMR